MRNNLYKSAAQVTAFSTIEKCLSFLYRIVLTRLIGAEGLGIYQICLTLFAVFLTAASSGVPVTVSRLMAKSNANGCAAEKHAAVTAGMVCTLCITVPVTAVLLLGRDAFSFLFSDSRCMPIFVILLPGLIPTSIFAVIRGAFWGNKQFLPYSLIELMEDAVMVVAGVALVCAADDPVSGAAGAAAAVLISYIFSFSLSLFWYFKTGGRLADPRPQLKPLLSSATPITAMRTSTSLLNSAVAVLLPALLISQYGVSGAEAVSLYGVAMGMAIPMLFIPNSFIGSIAVVVAPELSENYYKNNRARVRFDVEKTVKCAVFIAALLVPVLFALGGAVSDLLYANELCGEIVTRSSFIVLPMCITMMTNTVLNSMNCEKRTLLYFAFGAAAMLLCVACLTKYLGIYAYVLGLALSQIITAACNLRLLKKKCPDIACARYSLRAAAVIAVACLFGRLVCGMLESCLSSLWLIAVCAPLVLAFTAGGLYALGMFTFRPLTKLVSGR